MVRTIAAISLVYDLSAGVSLLFFRDLLPQWFGIPVAEPAIFLDLNAIFLLAVGVGYVLPYRDPERYRGYLWIFGVGLKTAGALAFLFDYWWRAAPPAILLFALSDAVVAGMTWVALARVAAGLQAGRTV